MDPVDRPDVSAIITVAMREEMAPFLDAADEIKVIEDAAQMFALTTLEGRNVVLVRSGIGLVNASVGITRALEWFAPQCVVVAGTCGGLAQQVEVGQIVAGVRALYGQADASAFGYAPGQIPQMPADYRSGAPKEMLPADHCGTVLSTDSFITSSLAPQMRAQFPEALATDMETAAIAQACYVMNVDWVSLRAVSDLCDPEAGQRFHIEAESAAKASAEATLEYLAKI